MTDIYKFFNKIAIEIKQGINLGNIEKLLFNNRLKQVFYLKTDKNFYIKFKDILLCNDCIIVKKFYDKIDGEFTEINSHHLLVKTDGFFEGEITEILVDNNGFLQHILAKSNKFIFKDIYNATNDLIILQSDKIMRPINNDKTSNKNNKNKDKKPTKQCKNLVKNNIDSNIIVSDNNLVKNNKNNSITIFYPTKTKQLKLEDVINCKNKTKYKPAKFIIRFNSLQNSSIMPKKIICNFNGLIGKKINEDIVSDTGNVLIKKHSVITTQSIKIASKYNKLCDVTCKI